MPETPEQNTTATSQQPWGVLRASLLCGLMPATTASRSAHVRLWAALLCHVCAALALVLVVWALDSWSWTGSRGPVIDQISDDLGDLAREIGRYPLEALAIISGTVLSIEGGYLVLALLFMSWGARDEPVRRSCANALGRLWLHTSHALVATFLAGLVIVPLDHARSNWSRSEPSLNWSPPQPPANALPNTPAWDAYQAEMDRYIEQRHQRRLELWRSRPWHVKHSETIGINAGLLASLWVLWALLRAIGAERPVPTIGRPPTCETCGYNLTAASMEGRCPECGQTVLSSLGPDVRPGTLWQRPREVGRLRAWWRCSYDAIVRPQSFGRQLKTLSPGTDHRLFLAMHLVPVFFIAAMGLLLCYYADTGRNPLAWDPEVVWVVSPATGCTTAAIALAVVTLAAGVAGIGRGLGQKRNLMPAAMQAASYLAGYLVFWTLFAAILGVATFLLEDWFRDLDRVLGVDAELLVFLFWLGPNIVCLLVYFRLVWRTTTAARYANR